MQSFLSIVVGLIILRIRFWSFGRAFQSRPGKIRLLRVRYERQYCFLRTGLGCFYIPVLGYIILTSCGLGSFYAWESIVVVGVEKIIAKSDMKFVKTESCS